MHHADRRLRFAITRLATGPQVHYAEQGDPDGETILFLPAYADSWFSYSRVLPLLPCPLPRLCPGPARPRRLRASGLLLHRRRSGRRHRGLPGRRRDRARHPGRPLGELLHRPAGGGDPPGTGRRAGADRRSLSLAKPAVLAFQATVHALEDPVPAEFAREFQAGAVHVPLPEGFLEGLVAESLKLPVHVWKAALDGLVAFDDAADLGRITASTLLIWGDHDAVVSLEDQQRLRDAVPDARLKVYPETGHSPHWERPERVAADLDASRDRIGPPNP